MEDFKLSDFMNLYNRQLEVIEHMHRIALNNLSPICKGCLRQNKCWDRFYFKNLCLIENKICLNKLED